MTFIVVDPRHRYVVILQRPSSSIRIVDSLSSYGGPHHQPTSSTHRCQLATTFCYQDVVVLRRASSSTNVVDSSPSCGGPRCGSAPLTHHRHAATLVVDSSLSYRDPRRRSTLLIHHRHVAALVVVPSSSTWIIVPHWPIDSQLRPSSIACHDSLHQHCPWQPSLPRW